MKTFLPITITALLVLSTPAKADSTWGVGYGPLYSGLGLNYGQTTSTSLTYGALGCVDYATGNRHNDESTGGKLPAGESNCGIALGYISTALFNSNKHGFGVNIGLTHNTDTDESETRLIPGYHYFMNGINERGLNLGVDTVLYYDRESSDARDDGFSEILFSVGFQF